METDSLQITCRVSNMQSQGQASKRIQLCMLAQVDLIICFDASASPIRNIQRIGRTGRHRNGRVLYILAAGKEMDNYFRNQSVRAR